MRKVKPDIRRSEDLINDSANRYRFIRVTDFDDSSTNYLVENCYDVIRQLIEAKLSLEGIKTLNHEETISYIRKLGFSDHDHFFLDELRKIRNNIKYEGKKVDMVYAKNVERFTIKIRKKLLRALGHT